MTLPRDFSLDFILAPTTPAEFIECTWGRLPLYIPGEAKKYEGFFSSIELEKTLQVNRGRFSLRAGFKDGAGEHCELEATAAQYGKLLAAGMTLFVTDLNPTHTNLGRLIRRLRTELGLVSKINGAYFTSLRDAGFGLHYDSVDVLSLQLEGVKRWWISERPARESPLDTCVPSAAQQSAGIHGFDETKLRQVTMRAGDTLYLPAGTWHRVSSEGHSLHVSIAFFKTDPLSILTALVMPGLRENPAWRRFPGLIGARRAGTATEARDAVAHHLRERARELQAALGALTDEQLFDSWRSYVDQSAPRVSEPSVAAVDLGDVLRFVAKDGFTFAVDPSRDIEDSLVIHQDNRSVTLPRSALGWAVRMAEHERFTAKVVSEWDSQVSWTTAQNWLRDLVRAGVLCIETS